MTALAGYWAFGSADAPRPSCERMLRAQEVYGTGTPASWSEGRVAVGRRLFPTLPEDRFDLQPVIGGGGRWTLVADVRLDDREGLAESLGIEGRAAAALADSGLVMKAVERWSDEAFARLVGEFAIALWDRDRERLLLARDFLVQRPLHYHRGDGFFAFASMPKGLLALPEVPRGPDERTVAEFLALIPHGDARSYFKGIERVLPGELCTFARSGLARTRHWTFAPKPLRLKRAEDYAEAVRETFDRSVLARLRGTADQVGVHLSGGLDSSTVAATAARQLAPDRRLTAFTSVPRAGFDDKIATGRFADEGAHAAAVAALYPNMDHVLVRSGDRSPLANLDRNFFLYERPVLNLCNGVWSDAILDEARERRIKVVLTGQMGNMTISYTGLEALPRLLARGRLVRLVREALLLHRHGTRLLSAASHAIGPYLPAPALHAIKRLAGRQSGLGAYSAIRPSLAAELVAEARARGLDLVGRPRRNSVAFRLSALGQLEMAEYHKGTLGGWGIDTRDPTADRRLVELCLSIPDEQYLAGGYTRALARRAFSDRLPALVAYETRKGYQAADWYDGLSAGWESAREEAARAAALPAAAATIDTERMARLLEQRPQGAWNSPATLARYRFTLLRGLSAAHFIRKASGSN